MSIDVEYLRLKKEERRKSKVIRFETAIKVYVSGKSAYFDKKKIIIYTIGIDFKKKNKAKKLKLLQMI